MAKTKLVTKVVFNIIYFLLNNDVDEFMNEFHLNKTVSSGALYILLTNLLNDQLKVLGTKILVGGDSDAEKRFINLTGVGKDPKANPILKHSMNILIRQTLLNNK